MSLDTLLPEFILDLPQYLHSIEDLLSLLSTCRTLYRTCANPNPQIVLRLAANSGRVFFRPHPHLLIAATACQVADWAVTKDSPIPAGSRHSRRRGKFSGTRDRCRGAFLGRHSQVIHV
ncbi:hypothetical protein K438DRAFT_281041 [Mycena galopus ATCC 62051]|nr:hypothetical protein K438DRAFT_281041 [Mycena galopus ATCC 62051]